MGFLIGSFNGKINDMGGPCVGLTVGGITIASDISIKDLSYSSHITCISWMREYMLPLIFNDDYIPCHGCVYCVIV